MRLSFAIPLKGVLEEMAEWDNDDDVFSGWVSDRFWSQSAAATSSYAQMKKCSGCQRPAP